MFENFLKKSEEWTISRKRQDRKNMRTRQKNNRGDRKGESNDSPVSVHRAVPALVWNTVSLEYLSAYLSLVWFGHPHTSPCPEVTMYGWQDASITNQPTNHTSPHFNIIPAELFQSWRSSHSTRWTLRWMLLLPVSALPGSTANRTCMHFLLEARIQRGKKTSTISTSAVHTSQLFNATFSLTLTSHITASHYPVACGSVQCHLTRKLVSSRCNTD